MVTPNSIIEREAAERASLISDVPANVLAGLKVRLGAADYKANEQATTWAGKLICELLDLDVRDKETKRKVRAMLAAWIEADELEIVQIHDAYRRLSPHVKPVAAPPI
jgi:hypothetical protein